MPQTSLTQQEKLDIVLKRNTFFIRIEAFEEKGEAQVSSMSNLLLMLQRELIGKESIEEKKETVVKVIRERPSGLSSILALTSISEELLLRLITFARIVDDRDLNELVEKRSFSRIPVDKECSKTQLNKLVREKKGVAESIVNLLFEGFSVPILQENLPLFELKKLNFSKFEFSVEGLIDSIVRLAKKGSFKARGENDPASLVKRLLTDNNVPFVPGAELPGINRNLDFVIPNLSTPKVVIESSYEVTTSSAMGDKAKTELSVNNNLKTHYPEAVFVGFVDGIGWYVRRRDLQRLLGAFDMVFTFRPSELDRFLEYVCSIYRRS